MENDIVYKTQTSKSLIRAVLFLIFSAFGLQQYLRPFQDCIAFHPCDIHALLVVPAMTISGLLGLVAIFGAAHNLPRLTLSSDGITHETIFRTRKIGWENLGRFEQLGVTRYILLRAKVTDISSDGSMINGKPVVIVPSAFGKKIEMQAELNAYWAERQPKKKIAQLRQTTSLPLQQMAVSLTPQTVFYRAFLLFLVQMALLVTFAILAASLAFGWQAATGSPLPDEIKTFTIGLFGVSYAVGLFIRTRPYRPNQGAALIGSFLFSVLAVPLVGILPWNDWKTQIASSMFVLLIPLSMVYGLFVKSKRQYS
jgi:hypothetical protein